MVVWDILETARGAIASLHQNVYLISQQKSPVTKEKIMTILERLYRLRLRGKYGGTSDKGESMRRDTFLSSVNHSQLPLDPVLNPYQCPRSD